MSKKKSAKKTAKKTRAASAPRRKATTKRSSPKRAKAMAAPTVRKVQMKPIKDMIDRAIADLQTLPSSDSTEITLRNLRASAAAFGDICDPDTPGGCSPTMEFLM